MHAWAQEQKKDVTHMQAGKAHQNASVAGYNGTVRCAWLAGRLFESIAQGQEGASRGLKTYHHERPHMAFGGITPMQKRAFAG